MTEPTKQQTVRQAYGRGWHDAMRSQEKDNDMNNARLAEAERELNGVAQKVLTATPKAEAWTASQIAGELRRTGRNIEHSAVLGCLGSMAKTGLVREPPAGQYMRVMPKEKPVLKAVDALASEPAAATPKPTTPPADRDTLVKIADLSMALRAQAATLTAMAIALDDVAIEVEERIQRINADSNQLAQLRALLKGIGV